jgi:hypothetical protein
MAGKGKAVKTAAKKSKSKPKTAAKAAKPSVRVVRPQGMQARGR